MATDTKSRPSALLAAEPSAALQSDEAAHQAFKILHLGFTVAPIVAGADKFFNLLVNWDQYLAPWIAGLSPPPP